MRALTLHQPWASLVAVGVKTIETRGWSTTYRGPLLIHAAKTMPPYSKQYVKGTTLRHDNEHSGGAWWLGLQGPHAKKAIASGVRATGFAGTWEVPLGAVMAVCTLADVVPIDGMNMGGLLNFVCPHDGGGLTLYRFGNGCWQPATTSNDISDQEPYGDFSEPGRYAWLLTDVRPLTTPVPAKGRQGLWTPDADLLAAVEAAR